MDKVMSPAASILSNDKNNKLRVFRFLGGVNSINSIDPSIVKQGDICIVTTKVKRKNSPIMDYSHDIYCYNGSSWILIKKNCIAEGDVV